MQKSQCRELFGQPTASSQRLNNNIQYENINYVYAYAPPGVEATKSRVLFTEFKQETLNAYNYVSDFEQDKTRADMNAATKVEVGRSTMQDVEAVMGRPNGKARKPTLMGDFVDAFKASEDAVEAWRWDEMTPKPKFGNSTNHSFVVLFNQSGVVVHVIKGGV